MQFPSGGSSNSVTPSAEYLVDPHSFVKSYSVNTISVGIINCVMLTQIQQD